MVKEFARKFYRTNVWTKARNIYAEKKHHLCEDCFARGIYTSGDIVHHVIELTPENITDTSVTLAEENLRLLCRSCHRKIHGYGNNKRFEILENGKIATSQSP